MSGFIFGICCSIVYCQAKPTCMPSKNKQLKIHSEQQEKNIISNSATQSLLFCYLCPFDDYQVGQVKVQ